jgi:RNA polymerase sigma-70 factor (ECF subfamily)
MSDRASPLWLARHKTSSTSEYATATVAELIEACTGGEAAAWQEFMRRFHGIIAITATRAARRWGENFPHTVDDLIQDTYLKLCADRSRVLREFRFEHQDAIFGFLKVVTANVVNDFFKGQRAGKRGGNHFTAPLADSENKCSAENPDGLAPPERALLVDQVDACLRTHAPAETRERDQTIFWLYYKQGMTAKEIAGLPGMSLSLKGVESTLYRLTQLVRTHLQESRPGKRVRPERYSDAECVYKDSSWKESNCEKAGRCALESRRGGSPPMLSRVGEFENKNGTRPSPGLVLSARERMAKPRRGVDEGRTDGNGGAPRRHV